jgi:predicted permease
MKLLAYFRSIAARFFHRAETESDLDEELHSHIQIRADDLERSGLGRAEAERRARLEFGGCERFKEEVRESLGGNFIETFLRDVRFSLRLLRKSPGFTTVAVLTLAVAIGANAVVFGVLDVMILRPLNVPQAESLYGIEHGNEANMYESYPDYLDLRDRNHSFDGLAGFTISPAGLDTGENPSQAWVYETSGNYFDVLRIQPYLGRFFHGSDEHGPNSAPYIVLTYAYWQAHFENDRGVVGRTVRLNKHPFTIAGVAPPDFRGTLVFGMPDFFVPLVDQELIDGASTLDARATHSVFMALGHLKPGVTPQQAAGDLNSIGAYLEKTYPTSHGSTTFVLARPGLYGNRLGGPMRAFIGGVMLLAGLILLAACANLGSLFAARAADRSREVALRLALGASRNRILRQLLTEAMLISLGGGALGLWGSLVLLRALSVWRPISRFPLIVPVTPDAKVYAVALALALVSGLLFGMVPVRQVLRADPYQIVKAGSGGPSSGHAGRRITVRDILLVVQVAICGVLVTSSFVAVRGLARSLDSNFGFEPRNAMLVETELSMAGYRGDQVPAMQKRMIDSVAAIPGVESVGLIGRPPLYGGGFGAAVYTDQTTDLRPSNAAATAIRFNISPEYLSTAGTILLAGRGFSWHDDKNSPRVAIINREFARKIFGSTAGAIGGRFKLRDGTRIQVVGVAEDGKYMSLTEDPELALFLPVLQAPMSETCLVVRWNAVRWNAVRWNAERYNRDPQQLAAANRTTLRNLDSGLPLFLETWNQQLGLALFPSRIATVSLGVLGGMGAILAITGIFGMAAYSVSKRLKELGIRVAIGAHPREVLTAALGRAFKLLAFGSAAGLILGILATRVLASIVYQANPRDPLVLAGVVLSMLLLGLLATWIPARRALSVDPLTLLREE